MHEQIASRKTVVSVVNDLTMMSDVALQLHNMYNESW